MKKLLSYDSAQPDKAVFRILLGSSVLLMLFGLFACGNPASALRGTWKIFTSSAILISDYIVVGGLDACFLNAGLAMLLAILVTKLSGAVFGGVNIGAAYIVAGFAMFGKNVPNMLPILAGTWLYARWKREPFSKHVNTALFATCCGPFVTQVALYSPAELLPVRLALGILMGLFIGFVIPPVAALTAKLHDGMLIFNVGLAAGLVGTVLVALLKSIGWSFEAVSLWSSGNDRLLGIFLGALFLVLILMGFVLNGMSFGGLGGMLRHTGQVPCDYTKLVGLPQTLMNMGILGFMTMGYVLVVGGPLNGPTMAGILTVVGFGAFGMNYYNIVPGILGIVLLSFVSVWSLNEPGILLGALFCTCICPIAGKYGPIWGILSGMLHVSIVRNTAVNYGWLNLYNNGYAAGIACILLLPLIALFAREWKKESASPKEAARP